MLGREALTPFERDVLRHFLEGPVPSLEILRAQVDVLTVADRLEDAGGLSVDFALPPDAPRLDRRLDAMLNDVLVVVPAAGREDLILCTLWIGGGLLNSLEVSPTGNPYPQAPFEYRLDYVDGARDVAAVDRALSWQPIIV
jgi:hypothetical protein